MVGMLPMLTTMCRTGPMIAVGPKREILSRRQQTTDAETDRQHHIRNRFVKGLDQFHLESRSNDKTLGCGCIDQRISVV